MVYFLYPETKGLSLEQIDHIFEGRGHGWSCLTQGVSESTKGPAAVPVPTPTRHRLSRDGETEKNATTTNLEYAHP